MRQGLLNGSDVISKNVAVVACSQKDLLISEVFDGDVISRLRYCLVHVPFKMGLRGGQLYPAYRLTNHGLVRKIGLKDTDKLKKGDEK